MEIEEGDMKTLTLPKGKLGVVLQDSTDADGKYRYSVARYK